MNVVLLGSNFMKVHFFLAVLSLLKTNLKLLFGKAAWRSHLSSKNWSHESHVDFEQGLNLALVLSALFIILDSKYFMLITGAVYPQRIFSFTGKNFSKVNSFSGRVLKSPWAIAPPVNEVYCFFEGKLYLNAKKF